MAALSAFAISGVGQTVTGTLECRIKNASGAIGRNTFFGQGLLNVDVAMIKSFRIREKQSLTFRAEGYGITNTPHFALPTASTLSQSFGRITSTYSPLNYVGASRSDASARIIQLALRYVF